MQKQPLPLALFLLALAIACVPADGTSNFQYTQSFLSGVYNMSWTPIANSSNIQGQIVCGNTGYIGFGSGTQMIGSHVMIGMIVNGSGLVQMYDLAAKNVAGVTVSPKQSDLVSSAFSQITGQSTISFLLQLNGTNSSQSVVMSYGAANVLAKHVNSQVNSINFATAAVSLGVEQTAMSEVNRQAHAGLMAVVYGFGFPLGAFIARYTKGHEGSSAWFQAHRIIQLTSWAGALASFGLIVYQVNQSQLGHFSQNNANHKIVGLIAVILTFLQPFNAALRPHPGTKYRRMWVIIHRSQAVVLWVLALAAIALGLQMANSYNMMSSQQATIGFIVIFGMQGIFIIAAAVAQIVVKASHETPKDEERTKVYPIVPLTR